MISAIIREFLLPLLLFLLLRSLLRGVFAGFRRPLARGNRSAPQPPSHSGGVLHKDPVCGVYVPADTAITRTFEGETVYFCSKECGDRYRPSQ